MNDNLEKWDNVKINFLEYFWSNSFFGAKNEKNLPYLIKKCDLFNDFSEIELFDLIKYMNIRNFSAGEQIFHQDDYGIGFYLILSGSVLLEKNEEESLCLYPKMYFGEKNLLLEKSRVGLNIKAQEKCVLASILIPDLDNMIDKKPRVAVKFIKALSKISLQRLEAIENRINQITEESKV